MTRIASLLPSATEIVAALGFADALVARSHECDHPAAVVKLPACTAPKAPLGDTSAEIDRRVRAIVREGLSVYRVDDRKLKSLDPGVIVTQSHCEVCAVSETELLSAVNDWLSQTRCASSPSDPNGWTISGPTSAASPTRSVSRIADPRSLRTSPDA